MARAKTSGWRPRPRPRLAGSGGTVRRRGWRAVRTAARSGSRSGRRSRASNRRLTHPVLRVPCCGAALLRLQKVGHTSRPGGKRFFLRTHRGGTRVRPRRPDPGGVAAIPSTSVQRRPSSLSSSSSPDVRSRSCAGGDRPDRAVRFLPLRRGRGRPQRWTRTGEPHALWDENEQGSELFTAVDDTELEMRTSRP